MRLRHLSLIAAFTAAVLFSGGHTSAQKKGSGVVKTNSLGKWLTFTGPEGDFRVDLPGRPSRGEDEPGLVTVIRRFELTTNDGMAFVIRLTDFGGDPQSRENNILSPDFDSLTLEQERAEGHQIIQTRRLSRSSWELECRWRLPVNGDRIHSIVRQTLHRGRLYHLGCGSIEDGKDVNRVVCRRFFGSLKFTS